MAAEEEDVLSSLEFPASSVDRVPVAVGIGLDVGLGVEA